MPQPFASWNIFDSALVRNASGHHYWETKALADELVRQGATTRLFSHRFAPTADEFPGVPITPVFSLFLYESISEDPRWSTLENFIVHNRTFFSELASLDPAQFRRVSRGEVSGCTRARDRGHVHGRRGHAFGQRSRHRGFHCSRNRGLHRPRPARIARAQGRGALAGKDVRERHGVAHCLDALAEPFKAPRERA